MAATATSTQLQRRIFSRWVSQKLTVTRNIVVKDIVSEAPQVLIPLIEVLSEVKCTAKLPTKLNSRIALIELSNAALSFVWSQGVEMKVKCSAEDLVDGVERQVLGLIWGIMQKFMKFGDDADSLSAKDALLLWVQNKTASYPNLKIESFKKSFRDGLALNALIHKHRPRLVDYDSLSPSNAEANIKNAFLAAEKYFQLEPYLTPAEYLQLDENSLTVVVAEFYYGIAEARKVDLSVRRLHALIAFTVENDRLRKEHNEGALKLRDHIKKVEKILEDRTIDNTMAGAQRRLEQFYEYKTNDKGVILGDQLKLEALFNNLSMRLAHRKRPEYHPPAGCTLKDVENSVAHLEECEQERKIALHAELNRQIKLVRWDNQHETQFQKLQSWIGTKDKYLNTKEVITSVGEAQYQLARLDAYDVEASKLTSGSVAEHSKLGAALASEKYENIARIQAREHEVAQALQSLAALSQKKRPVLKDDLAREQFRAGLVLLNHNHQIQTAELAAWFGEKQAYLQSKELCDTVAKAETQLSVLQQFDADRKVVRDTRVAALQALGSKLLAARYETQYSKAQWETPDEVHEREQTTVANIDSTLVQLSQAKLQVLQADLAREIKKEELRLQFSGLATDYVRWTVDTAERAAASQFGFDLPEVEAYAAVLKSEDAAIESEAQARTAAYTAVFDEAASLGVTENVYTDQSLDSLARARQELGRAQQARNKAYDAELQKQRENDALCKSFADVADPLSKWIGEQKDRVTHNKENLDSQLAVVDGLVNSIEKDGASIPKIHALQNEIDAKGITTNRHTLLTAKDVDAQWAQWVEFLRQKKVMLEEAIEHAKLRGITPEQYQEIEQNFQQFDKNGNGKLELKEFKACLYSLGEEKGQKEVVAIVEKFGTNGVIPYEGYKEFMISVLGDADTKDEVINSFKLINRAEVLLDDRMDIVSMDVADQDYLRKTAPKKDNGWDFYAWTEDVFSR